MDGVNVSLKAGDVTFIADRFVEGGVVGIKYQRTVKRIGGKQRSLIKIRKS